MSLIALNTKGERVHAPESEKGKEYTCPSCGAKMRLNKGAIRTAYFSHISLIECDSWKTNKTEWHYKGQNLFPVEYQEIVFELEGVKHRADVAFKDDNGHWIIVEFQHSSMSKDEFLERTTFYSQIGKLIWIIDMRDKYEKGHLDHDKGDKWHRFDMLYPKRSLPTQRELLQCNAELIFEFKENEYIMPIACDNDGYGRFYAMKYDAQINPSYLMQRLKKSVDYEEKRNVVRSGFNKRAVDIAINRTVYWRNTNKYNQYKRY